jgi:hypothetical protein
MEYSSVKKEEISDYGSTGIKLQDILPSETSYHTKPNTI